MKFWSICPKHWQLPRAVRGEDGIAQAADETFYNLLNKYGWEITWNSNGGRGRDRWSYETLGFNIRLNPFFLNSTDLIDLNTRTLRDPGGFGSLWNGTARSDGPGAVYFIGFDDYSIGPARADYGRANPTPLRCLTQ